MEKREEVFLGKGRTDTKESIGGTEEFESFEGKSIG